MKEKLTDKQVLEKIEKYFQAEQELDARVNLKVYREKTAKVEVTIPLLLHAHTILVALAATVCTPPARKRNRNPTAKQPPRKWSGCSNKC